MIEPTLSASDKAQIFGAALLFHRRCRFWDKTVIAQPGLCKEIRRKRPGAYQKQFPAYAPPKGIYAGISFFISSGRRGIFISKEALR